MNIRAFELTDINDCINDFILSFNSSPWNEDWSKERADEYIKDVFDSPKFIGFILYDGNENISYALCYKRYWWNKDDRYKLIMEFFFTKPSHQQKGYGSILLEYIERYAKENELGYIMLYTKKDKPAYCFYTKNGYTFVKCLVKGSSLIIAMPVI